MKAVEVNIYDKNFLAQRQNDCDKEQAFLFWGGNRKNLNWIQTQIHIIEVDEEEGEDLELKEQAVASQQHTHIITTHQLIQKVIIHII